MQDSVQCRVRRVGAISLGAALVVLLVGLTVLEPRLRGWLFVGYWLACFLLAGVAMLAALLDLWLVRRRARAARRELARQVFQRPAPPTERETQTASAAGPSRPPAGSPKVRG